MGAPGRSLGRAGGSLDHAAWAANDAVARIGKSGEARTGAVLDELAARADGPTVLHDLRIPIPGFSANIDHVVVSGRAVLLVDAKVWKPGFYWTLGGRTRRGLARFAHADKRTMQMAQDAITSYLERRRVQAQLRTPLVVVWPSSAHGQVATWAMQVPGARVTSGVAFMNRAGRYCGTRPADPAVVAALAPLVHGLSGRTRRAAFAPTAAFPLDDVL